MLKRFFQVFGLLILILVSAVLILTFTNKSIQPTGEKIELTDIDALTAAKNLSQAIKFATVSEPAFYQAATFDSLEVFLHKTYPTVFEQLEIQKMGKHSLLFKWKGKKPDQKPILFLGHQDVVPVEESSKDMWEQEPFSGIIEDGFIWGRGAIDDKSTVIGLLESCSALLKKGFQPDRSIYFFFGEDEETMGDSEAKSVADYFRSKNITFEAISDEGTLLTYNIVPGIKDVPVALIGIAEKGYLTLQLKAKIEGGHSSMPGKENAVSLLTSALNNLANNPFPYQISKPVEGFIKYMGPEMPFLNRMAFSNSTLMKSMIFDAYEKTNSGRAMIHTTLAPTIVKAGIKDNVIPTEATAFVNCRIMPGESIERTIAHIKNVIADERIELTIQDGSTNPSDVSEYDCAAFDQMGLAVKDVYPDALVTPFLMIAATDSRHFNGLSKHIYKFMPVMFESEDLARFHGVNERISVENFKKSIQVYTQCIVRWSAI